MKNIKQPTLPGPGGVCIILFIWVFPLLLGAQVEIERVEHYTYVEGLNDQVVRSVRRDKEGFVWVVTNRDLNRFDGYEFLSFDNLPNHRFRTNGSPPEKIEPLADGNLCLIYRKNLEFFDLLEPDNLVCKKVLLDASTGLYGKVRAIFMEPQGDIFILTTAGALCSVWRMNRYQRFEQVFSFQLHSAALDEEIFQFFKSKKSGFWVNTNLQGVFYPDAAGNIVNQAPPTEKNTTAKDTPPFPAEATIFREDLSGNIWMALKNKPGVYCFNEANQRFQLSPELPKTEVFSELWEDDIGNKLFATRSDFATVSKLYCLAKEKRAEDSALLPDFSKLLEVENKLLEVSGKDFFRDVFLGTYTGMYHVRLKNQQVRHFLKQDLKTGEFGIIIRGITGDGQSNVWMAREVDRWYHFDVQTGKFDTIQLVDEVTGIAFDQKGGGPLFYDPSGYIWGKSHTKLREGLLHRYSITTQKVRSYQFPTYIRSFCRSTNGEIWLSLIDPKDRGKLVKFNPISGQSTDYKNTDGSNPLSGRDGYFMSSWNNGEIWIATNEKLVFVNANEGTTRIFGKGKEPAQQIAADDLLTICKGEDGTVLIGTVGGGINILDPQTGNIQVFDKTQGLSNNDVCGIVPDQKGNYWASTFYGLNYFNRAEENFASFYATDGLSHNEYNRFSAYSDPSGLFFFGGVNGLNIFRAEDLISDEGGLQVRLTGISKYFGAEGRLEEINAGLRSLEKLIVEPGVSYFQLDFMLPEYIQSDQNQFAYWLEGQDKAWVYLGKTHTLRFNRLPPGHYILHLKAAGAKGIWKTQVRKLEIEVKEVFYRQTWFTTLLVMTFVGAVALIAWRREKAIRKREERRTRLNQKFADLELKALQAQMNPHFIFNALGAIQYLVQEGRIVEADNFLAKFAQLMRLFLESSKNKFITLAEEIRMLKLYVALEQLRFEGRFETKFVIDDELDPEDTDIPSMLIQPFIENAINHGLFHKSEKGHLNITFSKAEEAAIVCIVEDDGVGRKMAAQLQAKSLRSHKSRAMQIVQERLEALTHMDGYQVQIDIQDLENESNTGTRVSIRIPETE
ncbi:MAG: histidine kinase [Saprospiraceae bacterium]